MSNPEIQPMMTAIGMIYDIDYDADGDVSATDMLNFAGCLNGVDVTTPPAGCSPLEFDFADLDEDGDADMADAAIAMTQQNAN